MLSSSESEFEGFSKDMERSHKIYSKCKNHTTSDYELDIFISETESDSDDNSDIDIENGFVLEWS